ncbi:MAG: copper amine oxidase N-terminal domain-containing protein [Clostridiales bacterium]|nr:copper amine oxidase N-terminal domain-containing protein [Clostridiales bacterium]
MAASKRIVLILFCFALFSTCAAYGAAPQSISVYLKPDITIKVGDQVKSFYDEGGQNVFPLIYQGTTYLPVRAVSSLMGENIEWDDKSRTVYIGRTLSAPGKQPGQAGNYARNGDVPAVLKPSVQTVDALLMTDIIIMYDFEVQNFYDVNGRTVYPVNYLGSNYLPIRAVSKLMGEAIDWDAGQKLITISDKKAGVAQAGKKNENMAVLSDFLSDVVTVSDEATALIVNLQNNLTEGELAAMVTAADKCSNKIDKLIMDIKRTDKGKFSEEELDACGKLQDYAESASYYILVIENILYMAEKGEDYSIFGETFLNFAMDSQTKYEAAKEALKEFV